MPFDTKVPEPHWIQLNGTQPIGYWDCQTKGWHVETIERPNHGGDDVSCEPDNESTGSDDEARKRLLCGSHQLEQAPVVELERMR